MQANSITAIVHQMRIEAPNIVSLELRPTDVQRPFVQGQAGAHIDLHLSDGLVRSYSLVHPDQSSKYTVAVLKDRNSRGGSRYIHEKLRVGQILTISEPRNNFSLIEDAPASVLIAGGIGITPLYAMLQRLAKLGCSAHLIYCARSLSEAAYVHEIEKLVESHPKLSVYWHWDDEKAHHLRSKNYWQVLQHQPIFMLVDRSHYSMPLKQLARNWDCRTPTWKGSPHK